MSFTRCADIGDARVRPPDRPPSARRAQTIPHDFGFQKMSKFVIRDLDTVKSKLEMLASLSDVALATRLLSGSDHESVDAITAGYRRLACRIEPLAVRYRGRLPMCARARACFRLLTYLVRPALHAPRTTLLRCI